jgi:hypothetical protein
LRPVGVLEDHQGIRQVTAKGREHPLKARP